MPQVHDVNPNPKRNAVYDVAERTTPTVSKLPRANKPSYSQVGRDPYANSGAVGQEFLDNPSTAPTNA